MEDAEKLQAQSLKNQSSKKISVPVLIKDGKLNLQDTYNPAMNPYWSNMRPELTVTMQSDFRMNEMRVSPEFRPSSDDVRMDSNISPEFKAEISSDMSGKSSLNGDLQARQHMIGTPDYRNNLPIDCQRQIKTEYKDNQVSPFPEMKNLATDMKPIPSDGRSAMDVSSSEYIFGNYSGPANYQMQYANYMEQVPMDQNLQRLW